MLPHTTAGGQPPVQRESPRLCVPLCNSLSLASPLLPFSLGKQPQKPLHFSAQLATAQQAGSLFSFLFRSISKLRMNYCLPSLSFPYIHFLQTDSGLTFQPAFNQSPKQCPLPSPQKSVLLFGPHIGCSGSPCTTSSLELGAPHPTSAKEGRLATQASRELGTALGLSSLSLFLVLWNISLKMPYPNNLMERNSVLEALFLL